MRTSKRDRKIIAIANSRIVRGKLDGKHADINSYIAMLTDHAGTSYNKKIGTSELLQNMAGVYSWIRDNFHAKTCSEALEVIRGKGKIIHGKHKRLESKIVGLWIEEGMIIDAPLYNAVIKGYPQYKKKLDEIRYKELSRYEHTEKIIEKLRL